MHLNWENCYFNSFPNSDAWKKKANRKLANGQIIEDSEKENGPRASSAPALELNTIIFKHVYWYMQLISGERLQDHWSSGHLCL